MDSWQLMIWDSKTIRAAPFCHTEATRGCLSTEAVVNRIQQGIFGPVTGFPEQVNCRPWEWWKGGGGGGGGGGALSAGERGPGRGGWEREMSLEKDASRGRGSDV